MKDVELRYVGGHVEVYTGTGAFLFSADTLREAMEEAGCRLMYSRECRETSEQRLENTNVK